MNYILRTWAVPIVAAVVSFFTNWKVSGLWVHPYVERVSRMTGRPMGGGNE